MQCTVVIFSRNRVVRWAVEGAFGACFIHIRLKWRCWSRVRSLCLDVFAHFHSAGVDGVLYVCCHALEWYKPSSWRTLHVQSLIQCVIFLMIGIVRYSHHWTKHGEHFPTASSSSLSHQTSGLLSYLSYVGCKGVIVIHIQSPNNGASKKHS